MNKTELTMKLNQLKREIKGLQASRQKRKKKIEANNNILEEATKSKRSFDERVSQSQRDLFNRLNRIEGSFSSFYRKQYNEVLRKGDLDRATEHLVETINKAKHSIVKNEDEIESINRKLEIKKQQLKEYQRALMNMQGE